MLTMSNDGFHVTGARLAVLGTLFAVVTGVWQVTEYLQSHSYRLGTVEKDIAEQNTTNIEILAELKAANAALVELTRATDRLTLELDYLKEQGAK